MIFFLIATVVNHENIECCKNYIFKQSIKKLCAFEIGAIMIMKKKTQQKKMRCVINDKQSNEITNGLKDLMKTENDKKKFRLMIDRFLIVLCCNALQFDAQCLTQMRKQIRETH